jgi:hypothetical protein
MSYQEQDLDDLIKNRVKLQNSLILADDDAIRFSIESNIQSITIEIKKRAVLWSDYRKFVEDFFRTEKHKNERFGQAFMNRFGIRPDKKLFYCEDLKTCINIIQVKYLK